MGKLILGAVICAAIAGAAPAWAVGVDTPQDQGQQAQQIYLRETQQVTARAQLIYKLADNVPAAQGRAEVVEHSRGLVVYEPAATPAADPQVRPASPVHTTTTATVSWTPAPALPTPRDF
jgi:hypothetical protein